MALTIPTLNQVAAFDAGYPQTFTFNVIGGDQVTGSILTIKTNDAAATTVATIETTSFDYIVTLPAGRLTNGTYYQAYIQTKNAAGDTSDPSNIIQFYCYTTPEFEFDPAVVTVGNSSASFNVTYDQLQKEPLVQYRFYLYNQAGVRISDSGVIYTNSIDVPFSGSYLFTGFSNNTTYQIECVGVTYGNTSITTGRSTFTVSYESPSVYSDFIVTNNCEGGYMTITSNVVGIDGTVFPDPPKYVDDPYSTQVVPKKELDVTDSGSYVVWDTGYIVTDNYALGAWIRNPNPNSMLIELKNNDGDMVQLWYMTDDEKSWMELYVTPSGDSWKYEIKSAEIAAPSHNEQLFIKLICENNLYDISITNRGAVV